MKQSPLAHSFSAMVRASFVLVFGILILSFFTSRTGHSDRRSSDSIEPAAGSVESDARVLGETQGAVWFSKDDNSYSGSSVISFSSIEEPIVRVSSRSTNSTFTVSLFEVSRQDLLGLLLYEKDEQSGSSSFKQQFLDLTNRQPIAVKTVEHSGNRTTPVDLPLGQQGIWYLQATNGEVENRAILIRSKIGTVVKTGEGEFVYWSQDFATKAAQPAVNVTQYSLNNSITELGSGQTAENGLLRLSYNTNVDIALAESGSDLALIPVNLQNTSYLNWKQFGEQSSSQKTFIFTDRALYQPGDTIYYKAFVRENNDGSLSLPSGPVTLTLRYSAARDNSAIAEQQRTFSEWGSVDGSFTLDNEAKPGNYYLTLSTNQQNTQNYWYSYNSSVNIAVEYYTKPDYHLSIVGDQLSYVRGDGISFLVTAEYFSGQPIAGGEVNYTITSREFYDYDYLPSIYQDTADYRYGGWYGGDKIQSGTIDLDSTGSGMHRLDTNELWGKSNDEAKIFSVVATYQDSSGVPVKSQKNFLVFRNQFGIYRKAYSEWSSQINQPVSLEMVVINRRTGTPVPNHTLTLTAMREWWTKQQTNAGSGNRYHYVRGSEDIALSNTKTNEDGVATISFTPEKSGSYQIKAVLNDDQELPATRTLHWYVWGGDDYWENGVDVGGLTLVPNQKTYDPGETALISIESSLESQQNSAVLLTVERGRVKQTVVTKLDQGRVQVPIEILRDYMPNISIAAHAFGTDSLDLARKELTVSARQQQLAINVVSDQEVYGPGETVSLTIDTKDGLGRPVSAELALWAMDKALLELRESNIYGTIFERFWNKQYYYSPTSNSLAGINENAAEMGGGCFAGETQILMSDGNTKNIRDVNVGDRVYTLINSDSNQLQSRTVTDVHQTEVPGLLILNGNLKTTPNHILWVNNAWKEAGSVQPGDVLKTSDDESVFVTSVEWVLGKTTVYNLEVEESHTYFANNVYVHNQKGDVRDTFQDIAYWNPRVVTDGSGRATVRFVVPDNLTTWAVTAIGATKDTVVGQNTNEFRVSKDLVARPILPNFVRTGDNLQLLSLFHNFTKNDLEVTASLAATTGVIVAPDPLQLSLPSMGLEQLAWDYQPPGESSSDTLSFSLVADSINQRDVVKKQLQTIPYGFRQTTSQAGIGDGEYTLQLDPNADTSESSATIVLSPSIVGSLTGALNYLLDYPYGCIEQTTSRFVPLILALKEPQIFATDLRNKDTEAMFSAGIKRLTALQQAEGGWGWWYLKQNNPYVTAYVINYLIEARALGLEVPNELIDEAMNYFSTLPEQTAQETVLRRFALSFVDSTVEPISVDVLKPLPDDYVSLAVMANVRLGITNPQLNGAALLVNRALNSTSGPNWTNVSKDGFYSRSATGMAVRALVAANHERELAVKAAKYQMEIRQHAYWSNSYETAQLVHGMVELFRNQNEDTPDYSYTVLLDGETIGSGMVKSATAKIDPIVVAGDQINGSGSRLSVVFDGVGQLYSTVELSELINQRQTSPKSAGLTVERTYTNTKGEGYSFAVGDEIEVTLTVTGEASALSYLAIEDHIPAGMVAINTRLANENGKSWRNNDWYGGYYWDSNIEIYPERIVFATGQTNWNNNHSSEQTKTFQYTLRALVPGTFGAPPAQARLMYTPEIYGRSSSDTVEIGMESTFDPTKVTQLLDADALPTSGSVQRVLLFVVIGFIGLVIIGGIVWWRRGHRLPRLNNRVFRQKEDPILPPELPQWPRQPNEPTQE